MNKPLLIFLLLSYYIGFSQIVSKPIVYVTEDYEPIIQSEFLKRITSIMYYEDKIESDSISYRMARQYQSIEKINITEIQNIRALIKNNYSITTQENETLVIHFMDSLFGYNQLRYNREPEYVYEMKNKDTVEIRITKELFLKKRKSFDESIKKCHKKSKKLNAKHIYLYRLRFPSTYNYSNIEWLKINDQLNQKLFNNRSGTIIISPEGYKYRFVESNKNIEKLIKKNRWDDFYKEHHEHLQLLPQKSRIIIGKQLPPLFISDNANKESIRKTFEKYQLGLSINVSCFNLEY